MDIIRIRQERRGKQIDEISKSIYKAQLNNKEIDKKQIIMAAMSELNISKRTATEYVDVAFFKLENKE